MAKKIILSLVFAIVGYFLGIVADATHDTELANLSCCLWS